ncbi:MAG: glycosyltransferase [Blastocatellia bacterium]
MKRVCIGIHVHAEPDRLHATLASIRANTCRDYELLLLPDGPDEATKAALAALGDLPQSGTSEPRGAATCFNRLAATGADIIVLLESGSLVGPAWLDYLLAALDADPGNGLAGPSTNYSWNEQCVYPHSGSSPEEIARTAREAALRFGNETRTLEPLHSLADFCYVVRCEVIERIGAADEGYGTGPCWEMDYNIRAARGGFRGVWACASYAHRSPFTARRRLEESRRFEASKHRYQDKYCGARLRGEKSDYRSHCRGDACQNFAPQDLIAIHQPFSEIEAITSPRTPAPERVQAQSAVQLTTVSEPLVSCIMPTYNRRSFIPQSIRCFLRQDYCNTELVVVDDGTDPILDCIPQDPRIRYIRLDQRLKIGAKRNLACSSARGEFIAHWDDDDWYPTWRVRAQLDVLLNHAADVCGSSRIFYCEAATDKAWEYNYTARGAAWVCGSTLAYRKSFWQRNKFRDVQVGEDTSFVWQGESKRIYDLAQPDLCVAMIHSGNTSPKETGGSYWLPQPSEIIHRLLGNDQSFYRASCAPGQSNRYSLVSCIMPTYNRRRFMPLALQFFLYQDYPNKELIVVDDGDDSIEDLVSNLPGAHYIHLRARVSIGAKRNQACSYAKGEIIAHWDDDDWNAPDRLRYQVAPILSGEADMTGLENAFVLELPVGQFWTTHPELHEKMFAGNVHGGTLVYRKELLNQGLRYPEVNLAEDAWLLRQAVRNGKRLLRLSNPGVFVYVRHGCNSWGEFTPGQFINPDGWERIARPPTFPASLLSQYQIAAVNI